MERKKVNEICINKKNNSVIIKIDPFFYRPQEVNSLKGINSKLSKILNWKPKFTIDNLIKIMIEEEIKLVKLDRFY